MSTFISEPGTRLGGRYRLEDRVSAGGGWAAWKAIDETLARPVAVLTFARGFPRIGAAVTAARAASRLTDARLAQVFDVEEGWEHAYVVLEWVAGDSLEDLLADGPLDPRQGAELIAQGAEALAAAHAAGVAHLCLGPGSLRWTPGGGVKIIGVGIDAALSGVTADDPALADAQGLGKLLYAALTACWPGGDWPSLPPAPEIDGRPCSPRQVRAGVPAAIDDITCRVLFGPADGGSPITAPAMLAAALARVIPAPAAPPPVRWHGGYHSAGGVGPATVPGSRRPDSGSRHAARGPGATRARPPAARLMAACVGILALAAVGAGAWMLSHHGARSPAGLKPSHHPSSAATAAMVLHPVSAAAFGPAGGDNASQARYAIDGRPGTDWTTDSYQGSPRFGNLYDGTGLIVDMGRPVRVSSVTVTFGSIPGAHARVEVGNSNVPPGNSGSVPAGFVTLDRTSNASGTVPFRGHAATGRFVLIWFTKLARQPGQAGHFQADVSDVVVRGSS
jgi:hypothetical protein